MRTIVDTMETAHGLPGRGQFVCSCYALALLWLGLVHPLHAQPAAAANRVLQLDGTKSYLELPPNTFDSLTEATVEGWVKWEQLRRTDRFFDFGDHDREMYVRPDEQQLIFLIVAPDGTRHRTAVAGILRSNEWFHIAAVSGPGGATLYFNGTLVGTNAWQGSFAGLVGRKNYLGKSNYSSTDPTTPAQMDEVRVWNHARTPEQIRDGMFKPLTGKEPGLVGYWNFDDGTGKDRAPGHRDGKLMGGAKIIEAELPTPETIRRVEAVMLAGRVTDREGRLLSGAAVQVHQDGKSVATVRTELSGDYQLVFPANRRPYEVRVVWSDLGAARTNVLFFERQTHSWDFLLAETTLPASSSRATINRRPRRKWSCCAARARRWRQRP